MLTLLANLDPTLIASGIVTLVGVPLAYVAGRWINHHDDES